ncbi:MAG: sigma-70 family RNA polymerase sigma factor [Deltaproteobacteria bacterium]|nr:sigma-70 family RNA polymerase sigma factor [Deltaproteobacteria bacterium]
MRDEESLVRRAQARDAEAFDQLYEAHFEKVYRYVAMRLGNEMEAEDVTQEVFLKALSSISSFRWKGVPFLAWLYRIARNHVIDHYRKKPKTPPVSINNLQVSEEGNPVEIAEQKSEFERIMKAARKLTEAQREVIALRFVSDLSISETAQVMKRSEGAVKALQHSALSALRRVMASNAI